MFVFWSIHLNGSSEVNNCKCVRCKRSSKTDARSSGNKQHPYNPRIMDSTTSPRNSDCV